MPGIALLSAYCPLPPHRAVGPASAARGARGDRRAEGAAPGGILGTACPATGRDRAAVCSPPVPPGACDLYPCAGIARAAAAANLARAPGAPAAPGGRAAAPPDHGRPALGRSLHTGVAQPAGGSRSDRSHPGPVYLSAGLQPAVDGALASHPGDTGPLAPAPGHRTDAPGSAGQGAASGGGRADRGQDRWGTAVRGGVNKDGTGIRPAPGAGGSLCAHRVPAAAGNSRHAARLAAGAARPPGGGKGPGATRGDAGARVCLCPAPGRCPVERGDCTTAVAAVSGGGVAVPAGATAAGNLRLQARPDPGGGVSIAAQADAAALPSADCPRAGGAVSRYCRGSSRTAGAPLHGGGVPEAGGGLLAAGG